MQFDFKLYVNFVPQQNVYSIKILSSSQQCGDVPQGPLLLYCRVLSSQYLAIGSWRIARAVFLQQAE
jgi:hypothetical protein